MYDLGTLGGHSSNALDINNKGQIVGNSHILNGDSHAFLYDSANGMLDLNDFIDPDSGWVLTIAYGINDLGQIIGSGEINGQTHAFLMTPIPEPATILLFGLGGLVLRKKRK